MMSPACLKVWEWIFLRLSAFFFKRAVIERGLPFNVSELSSLSESSGLMSALRTLNEEALKNGSAGMSEEEIEAEIKAARAKIKR